MIHTLGFSGMGCTGSVSELSLYREHASLSKKGLQLQVLPMYGGLPYSEQVLLLLLLLLLLLNVIVINLLDKSISTSTTKY